MDLRSPRLSGFRPDTDDGAVQRDDDGIIEAMGGRRASLTPAQLVNRLTPTTWIYEAVWRKRSLSLLAGRPFPIAEELAELVAAVGSVSTTPPAVVLDVACSEGLYGRHLAQLGADVILIDHSRPFLRKALQRYAAEGISDRVDAVRALAAHLPWDTASVDAVVMGGSLNEIGDQAAAVAEMVRVLRPGGRLFIMSLVPAPDRLGRLAQAAVGPSGIRYPTAARTVAWLGSSMELVSERLDGAVLRVCAQKR